MVHFKRKPVQYISPPAVPDDNAEVWIIQKTEEVFTSYESFLRRHDFYQQKRFTCEITGHSGLTFFEAMESEMEGSKELDSTFPEPLREPVLRKAQFSTISRIDDLVSLVFAEFKNDYFPRERVTVVTGSGDKLEGFIREKVIFPELKKSDGSIERTRFSRYSVTLVESQDEIQARDDQLVRDRRIFTKQILRSFLRNSLTRAAWSGAPWLVKEKVAQAYHIDTTIPPELHLGARLNEKKPNLSSRKGEQGGTFFNYLASQRRLGEEKPASKQNRNRNTRQDVSKQVQHPTANGQAPEGRMPAFVASPGLTKRASVPSPYQFHQYALLQPIAAKAQTVQSIQPPPLPPPPPPPKYPIEDMDIRPRRHGLQRPKLQLFEEKHTEVSSKGGLGNSHISKESVGLLLEVWNTLNVHLEVFLLDSFTFDDFVDAMLFSSSEVDCELFVEIHCAALKLLVSEEGGLQVSLPELPSSAKDPDSDANTEGSLTSLPTPEPEIKRYRRATRSSVQKAEVLTAEGQASNMLHGRREHRAAEMLAGRSWVERLAQRDFKHGGWQIIVVGLLHQVSMSAQQREVCEHILAHLAPVGHGPTQEVARQQYLTMTADLRIAALQMICMLAVQTRAIRSFLEQCNEWMTELRKEKIEWQRKRKPLMEELRELDEQRKALLPESPSVTPSAEVPDISKISVGATSDEVELNTAENTEDEEQTNGLNLRRGADRATERKRKREEGLARKEKDRKQKTEGFKVAKQSARLAKILQRIQKKKDKIKECEAQIADLENDLRETNCQRTISLGRDRFFNRYYWFERNGMPFAGLPSSSGARAGYANGRLWVQGPDELEQQSSSDVTLSESRSLEEGSTRLHDARQWGYYDDPTSIDALIEWLDERGQRERALRKELQAWRETIVKYMSKMQEHLAESNEQKAGGDEHFTRMSTRNKTYVDLDAMKHPCLAYRNTYALDSQGHLHVDQPKSKKAQKASVGAKTAKVSLGKTGKPLTRQGLAEKK